MTSKLWNKFVTYGSGFVLEADRDYDIKGKPFIYHLQMSGLCYPDNYEIIGYKLEKLMEKAIKDGEKEINKHVHNKKPKI